MPAAVTSADPIGRAIALRIATALSFALMAALLKLASTRGVTAPELLLYRSIFALPVVLAWAWIGPGLTALRPVNREH